MRDFRFTTNIQLNFQRSDVLARLRENLGRHRAILAEANDGYRAKAAGALEAKLAEIRGGEAAGLDFELRRPVSHVRVYEAMISMFEDSSDASVTLSMDQQQALMCDAWDWQEGFLEISSSYSGLARDRR